MDLGIAGAWIFRSYLLFKAWGISAQDSQELPGHVMPGQACYDYQVPQNRRYEGKTMSRVMIHPATYENVRQAVDRAFELFPLEIRGKSVLIKPNVLRISEVGEGIVTHPAVLRAVVEKVETMGPAAIVVGDNPGLFNYGANEESFQKTGLMEAAKGYYQNIGNNSLQVDFNPDFMPTVSLSQIVRDADIIISLPKFKTH